MTAEEMTELIESIAQLQVGTGLLSLDGYLGALGMLGYSFGTGEFTGSPYRAVIANFSEAMSAGSLHSRSSWQSSLAAQITLIRSRAEVRVCGSNPSGCQQHTRSAPAGGQHAQSHHSHVKFFSFVCDVGRADRQYPTATWSGSVTR